MSAARSRKSALHLLLVAGLLVAGSGGASARRLFSRTVGGQAARSTVPPYLVTAWLRQDDQSGAGYDNLHAGNGLRLDDRNVLLPRHTVNLIERSHKDVNPPAFLFNNPQQLDTTKGANGKVITLQRVGLYIRDKPFSLYRTPHLKPPMVELARTPKLETNKSNFGTDCALHGYSRELEGTRPQERRRRRQGSALVQPVQPVQPVPPAVRTWSQLPLQHQPGDLCLNGMCKMISKVQMGEHRHLCKRPGDLGLPIYCGPSNDRKITYITGSYENGTSCRPAFNAYHVPSLMDGLNDAYGALKDMSEVTTYLTPYEKEARKSNWPLDPLEGLPIRGFDQINSLKNKR